MSWCSNLDKDHTIRLVADPMVGLPYGKYPRLVLVWLTSECVKNYNAGRVGIDARHIEFGSYRQLMQQLNIPLGSKSFSNFRDQLRRLQNLTIRKEDTVDSVRPGVRVDRFSADFLLSQLEVVFNNPDFHVDTTGQYELGESYVIVSEAFYNLAIKCPIPVDWEIITKLDAAQAIDIYLVLSRHALRGAFKMSWQRLKVLFGAGYANTSQGFAGFRRDFKKNLDTVCLLWQNLIAETDSSGLIVKAVSPSVPTKQTTDIKAQIRKSLGG